MPTALLLPDRVAPTNLHLSDSVRRRFVTHDLYDICKRMEAISPSLYAVEMEDQGAVRYAIMERCVDGVDRLVFRVDRLDGRVIERLGYLMTLPLQGRLDQIERDHYKFEEDRKANELEDLYERMGRPMWTELEKSGFITRPVSYPKRGVAGGRGSLSREAQ